MDFVTWASNYLLDPKMAYAYGLVVIFILIYLIRPKPRHQVMPSLMFLFKDLGRNRSANFIRNLITNLLFLLQLLLMIAMVTAIAKPYVNVSKEALFKNTVIVLDVSASMKAPYEGETRFEKALDLARENLGSINTLILVKKVPQAVLIDESGGKVRDYLGKLDATDNPTNLYSAISAAGSYAKPDSRVVVISDFIDTNTDTDLNTIKKTLESQGIKVDYLKVFSPAPNIGIVEVSVSESKTTAVVKNFNPESAEVNMKINDLTENLKIAPNSREAFTFTTPARTNKLEMEVVNGKDLFKDDNTAYISAPSDTKKRVLLITNNEEYDRTYVFNAFDVMKSAQLEVAIPPKIPDLSEYDVFVFKDVDPNLILPGTFKAVKKEVEEKGKAAIVMAQPNMLSVEYQGLSPLIPSEAIEQVTNINPTSGDAITANIEFGITKKYFKVQTIEGRTTIVFAASEDKTPLIAFNKLGLGSVIYYGVLDEDPKSEVFFGKSPSYFVFWKRTLDFITNTPSIKNLNYKTGSVLSLGEEQRIETPHGKVTTKELSLDNQGMYTLKDRVIAINLAEEMESDISNENKLSEDSLSQSGERFKEKVPYEFTDYFIYAALLLIFLELLYVKLRGDF